MERRRRTYIHRGKVRFKRRIPRKTKKARSKKWEKEYAIHRAYMMKLHGDKWMDYICWGG